MIKHCSMCANPEVSVWESMSDCTWMCVIGHNPGLPQIPWIVPLQAAFKHNHKSWLDQYKTFCPVPTSLDWKFSEACRVCLSVPKCYNKHLTYTWCASTDKSQVLLIHGDLTLGQTDGMYHRCDWVISDSFLYLSLCEAEIYKRKSRSGQEMKGDVSQHLR